MARNGRHQADTGRSAVEGWADEGGALGYSTSAFDSVQSCRDVCVPGRESG
jgi:hypothetical protein